MDSSSLQKFLSLVPVDGFEKNYSDDISGASYFGFPLEAILKAEEALLDPKKPSVAYFSMEYGLSTHAYNVFQSARPVPEANKLSNHRVFSNLRAMDYYLFVEAEHRLDLPIYSGGLGVLAGDTLKSVADLGISLGAVGILWNRGYFKQNFWFKSGQIPEENNWDPFHYPGLVPLKTRIQVPLKKGTIHLRLWKYFVYSFDKKNAVPLVLLDSDVEENSEFDRKLTSQLYKSDDEEWRLLQRAILGLGGRQALETLGYAIQTYHLNEGHAALAYTEEAGKNFAYTCHTPVAAGHDRFQKKLLESVLPEKEFSTLKKFGQDSQYPDLINLTEFSMTVCKRVNAVAAKHGEITRIQFPAYRDKIQSVTNGVHAHTWISEPIAEVLDARDETKNWRENPSILKNALDLKPDAEFRDAVWNAHQTNKKKLCALLKGWKLDANTFTICWARRIAAYKRPSLILQDVEKILQIAKKTGPIQILFAGKAHPKDNLGFTHVNEMMSAIDALEKDVKTVRVLMLENYDTYFGKLLASSVDVWLNNPLPPFEASGTSGMKAILNGVLQLSTLDGWVVEAAKQNIGWIFGYEHHGSEIGDEKNLRLKEDSSKLYEILEKVVALYYQTKQNGRPDPSSEWIDKMIHAIAAAGFFNTQRMAEEYREKIWDL